MASKKTLTPLAVALSTTFAVSMAASPLAGAAGNPFTLNDLGSGYMVAEGEGKCGGEKGAEGKCGGEKGAEGEGKCGEGKCGG